MPTSGLVTWHGALLREKVQDAAARALGSAEELGHAWWDVTAPVSSDKRTRGGLRRSWFSYVNTLGNQVVLIFGANSPHAIYVELGTSKMPPQAPLRTVAGEMTAALPSYIEIELGDL